MLLLVLTLFRLGSGGGGGNPDFFLHISFSWVEIRLHTEFQLPMLLRSGSFMVVDKKKRQGKASFYEINGFLSPSLS